MKGLVSHNPKFQPHVHYMCSIGPSDKGHDHYCEMGRWNATVRKRNESPSG